ncbi:heterokaryon incompatibility protein-domain-containing protein [Xylaria sp. FL0064]|nr:heterokaryon incompatibility protein-domain-containing protein [Xylaria sp. FL0064]
MEPITYDSCGICATLWDALTSNSDHFIRGMPCLDEILRIPCPGHESLFQYLKMELAETTGRTLFIEKKGFNNPISFFTNMIDSGQFKLSPKLHFAIAKWRYESRLRCHGRILDQKWIDDGLIKEWMDNCAVIHGDMCTNPARIPQISPDWLIDTVNACIVPGRGIVDYVALSYRWGASKGFRMGTESFKLEVIRQAGALAEAHIAGGIPTSIADAIKLVRSIGERYLWVDAVCIDQSDEVHFGRQVEMMGAIYASAKLTIIATDGDATDGIKGLKSISSPRGLQQVIIPLFEHCTLIGTRPCAFRNISQLPALYTYFGVEGDSEYFQRGWTHQEFHLSKRRLIFYKRQAFWQCTGAHWCEDIIHEKTASPPPDSPFRDAAFLSSRLLNGLPDLDRLSSLLNDYNSRDHSYAEDALPGIMGLLSILSRSFEPGFLCGLPEACFDAALLWRTYMDPDRIRRRLNTGRGQSSIQCPLPSWSWVGWQTPALWIAEGETFEIGANNICRTTPITQWFTHESPHTDSKRPIQPTWFSFRERVKNFSLSLPPGWTKRKPSRRRAGSELFPPWVRASLGVDPEYVYCPLKHPELEYWLPFPVATTCKDRIPSSLPQTPFISCRTKRGWFRVGRISHSMDNGWKSFLAWKTLLLSSEEVDDCGTMEPQIAIDTLLSATQDGLLQVELVAICIQTLKSEPIFGNDEWHEVYGVLWIEWVDGVAYRKGRGVVYKEVWESHNLEDVDLILG